MPQTTQLYNSVIITEEPMAVPQAERGASSAGGHPFNARILLLHDAHNQSRVLKRGCSSLSPALEVLISAIHPSGCNSLPTPFERMMVAGPFGRISEPSLEPAVSSADGREDRRGEACRETLCRPANFP